MQMCLSTTAIDVDLWKLTLNVCTQWVLREEKENCWTTMVRESIERRGEEQIMHGWMTMMILKRNTTSRKSYRQVKAVRW